MEGTCLLPHITRSLRNVRNVRFDAHKARKWKGIKDKNKNKIKCIHKPDTMLLIMLGVFKDLKTAMVDDVVWVLKRCVGGSVVMKIGDIHLGSTQMTGVWLELWSD